MKKIYYIGISCLFLLLVSACTSITTTPHFYSFDGNTEYEVLGEVIYESDSRIGYTELLRAARRLYPDCDFVIDIMIDRRETTTGFFFWEFDTRITWIMRGTAIRYVIP
jgi:hypothetical protein